MAGTAAPTVREKLDTPLTAGTVMEVTYKNAADLDRIRKIFAHAVQRKAVAKEIAGKFVEYFCGAVEVPQEVFVIKATVSLQKGVSP